MAGGIVSGLFDWTLQVIGPWGLPGLFVVSLTEAFVSPLPVEALLVPFSVADPGFWPGYGLVASVGSVLGSLVGYVLGLKGGHPLLVRMAGEEQAEWMERYYERWGAGAVFITGITPLPYKVFTVGSGVLELDLKKFTAAAALGRGTRFMAIAYASARIGDEILVVLDRWFWPVLVVASVVVAAWAIWAWKRDPVTSRV